MISLFFTKEIFRSAMDGLREHKLRSILTTLGIIFGVAAVIGMASIGEGARREALAQIERMGVGNILIDSNRPEEGETLIDAIAKNPSGLTLDDADALRELVPNILRVVPVKTDNPMISTVGKKIKMQLVSTLPDYFDLYNLKSAQGRWINTLDEADYRRVCVLGAEARRKLFPLENPLGRVIKVHNNGKIEIYTVVGVLAHRNVTGAQIEGIELKDENLDVYIPLETILKRVPPVRTESQLNRIVVQVKDPESLSDVVPIIERTLNRRHREAGDFKVVVPEELLRQHQQTQRIFNIVMGAIAGISLLVGGIGIMNIMLASVLERTREIGIRRAIGARQADIARQFLMEAVLLSLLGGLIGVLVGLAFAFAITIFAGWQTAVSLWSIFLAVGVSATVGVVFGFLPARQASRLDPITALRFE